MSGIADWRYAADLRTSTPTDRAAAKAERSAVRPVRRRRLLVGGKEYAAFDAHDLLDATAADLGRPGHPY